MKKIILSVVFVFASLTVANAKTDVFETISNDDCFEDAWRYGTEQAESWGSAGDQEEEFYWMDVYYSNFCE